MAELNATIRTFHVHPMFIGSRTVGDKEVLINTSAIASVLGWDGGSVVRLHDGHTIELVEPFDSIEGRINGPQETP